ncbi:hypothetical protein [Paraburkholderia megapolitana]|uniref:hypothetical protein n=1 Tax=Paraburkholderia megapolitana TaxID=420953 RepID=UPI0038B782EA
MSAVVLPFIRRLPAWVDQGELQSMLNITTVTTVKDSPGRIMRLSIIRGGCDVYDCADVRFIGPHRLLYRSPVERPPAPVKLEAPCLSGITIIPAADSVIAVTFL